MGLHNISEIELVENKGLRGKYIGKVEILNKVKELLTLPNTELMTTKMVAEFYEVEFKAVEKLVQRNVNELKENGMDFRSYSEVKETVNVNSDIMSELKISRRGTNIFSKRAVLNVGMLLRDSTVAKRVRTALLDHQEILSDEQKVNHIEKEQELALKIVFANSPEEQMLALSQYREYKNKHITELKETIEKQKPKVENYDTFMDGSNYQKMNVVAKTLGYGRNNLFKLLRELKILMRDNTPYQKYIDSKYFVVKEKPVRIGKDIVNKPQTYVTPRGVEFINDLLNENKIIRIG